MSKANKVIADKEEIYMFKENFEHGLEVETKALVYLTIMFKNKVINHDQLMGKLRALKAGTLTSYKNTHYSSILKSWTNDQYGIDILAKESGEDKSITIFIPMKLFIDVLMLYTGHPYNACLNYMLNMIFKRVFTTSVDGCQFPLHLFVGCTLPEFDTVNVSVESMECECCGQSTKSVLITETWNAFSEKMQRYQVYKRGNLKKIPSIFSYIRSSNPYISLKEYCEL